MDFFSETPQGSLPVLEIDGKKKICQSVAIARYLAREFSKFKRLISSVEAEILTNFYNFKNRG